MHLLYNTRDVLPVGAVLPEAIRVEPVRQTERTLTMHVYYYYYYYY